MLESGTPTNGDEPNGQPPASNGSPLPGEPSGPDISELPTIRLAQQDAHRLLREQRAREAGRHRDTARRLNREARILEARIEDVQQLVRTLWKIAMYGSQTGAQLEEAMAAVNAAMAICTRLETEQERIADEVAHHLLAADLLDRHAVVGV
jgi:hypothetical protein